MYDAFGPCTKCCINWRVDSNEEMVFRTWEGRDAMSARVADPLKVGRSGTAVAWACVC